MMEAEDGRAMDTLSILFCTLDQEEEEEEREGVREEVIARNTLPHTHTHTL